MSLEIIHSIILIIAIALAFIFPKTALAQYDMQIAAALFLIFFVGKKITSSSKSRLLESVVFTLIVLLIVNSTGGVNSDMFFLVYFLLFSLSLLLEPVISITTTLTLVIFYLVSLPKGADLKQLIPIFSLAFLTPFAMFIGEEFRQIKILEKTIVKNKENTFLFLSLILKNHLKSIKRALENFMGDHELSQIKKHTKEMERLINKYEKS